MRAGTWGDEAVQPVTARATIGAQTVPVEATVESSLYDAHPAHPSTSPSSTGTLRVGPGRAVTRLAPDPVTRPAGWPPATGTPVTVDVGDGAQWFRQLTGEVDETAGSLATADVTVDAIDHTESLDVPVGSPAVASLQPPIFGSGEWRYVGMCSAWLVDRAARRAGFYAGIPNLWETRLSVPMMGSLVPDSDDHGIIMIARRSDGSGASPALVFTSWGVALADFSARYVLPSSIPAGAVTEITIDLPPRRAGEGIARVRVYDASTGETGFQAGYDHDTDEIFVGTWVQPAGTVSSTHRRIPRAGATRMAVRVSAVDGTQTMLIRRDNDPAVTTFTETRPEIGLAWSPTHAVAWSAASLGGFTVAASPPAWLALDTARTARIRVKEIGWWVLARDTLDKTSREVLTEIADAECAAYWVDDDGLFQWAGPGVLEAQQVAVRLTTRDAIRDLPWRRPLAATARQVRLSYGVPAISRRTDRSLILWSGNGATGLQNGDVWEEIAEARDDEDWFGQDWIPTTLSSNSDRSTVREGSTQASEMVNTATEGNTWGNLHVTWTVEEITKRSVKWTAEVHSLPAGHEINLNVPESATNLPAWWRGRSQPRLRGYAHARWTEKRDTTPTVTTVTTGPVEYVHECSHYVQDATRRTELRQWLKAEMSRGYPTFGDVPVRPDPRVQVGDLVELEDPDRTGLLLRCVVQGITSAWRDGDASMSLRVRVVSHVKSAVTDLPDPHWLQSQPDGMRAV